MKINSIDVETTDFDRRYVKSVEIDTDKGRRHIRLTAPIDIDPTSATPSAQFQSLAKMLWDVLHQVALQVPTLAVAAPKVEA